MQPKRHDPRLIAIDLRSQQFGYAVFEGPKRILDYGGGQLRPGGKEGSVLAVRRIGQLIKLFTPSAIAVKHPDRHVTVRRPGIRTMANAIQREVSAHQIPFRLIGRDEVRETFQIFRAENKYDIAVILTQIFPELLWKLPAKRKLGDPEHPRMVVFDAISVGFTYWQPNGTQIPPP